MKGKIFNPKEVQAILNGSKVMFREVIKPQLIQPEGFSDAYFDCYNKGNQWNWWTKDNKQLLGQIVKCPYQVGQKIFCKESFSSYYEDDDFVRGDIFLYRAHEDSKDLEDVHWKPAQHMKQEHSRLTLQIKEIRVERLADISEEDAKAEGVEGLLVQPDGGSWPYYEGFRAHWNATHKKPEEKFEANPFVFVCSFGVTT